MKNVGNMIAVKTPKKRKILKIITSNRVEGTMFSDKDDENDCRTNHVLFGSYSKPEYVVFQSKLLMLMLVKEF